jgi:signal transduction histidine kinase
VPDSGARVHAELNELRQSRRRMVLAADADRRALEGELHDGIAQDLVAVAMLLRRARDLLASDAEAAAGQLAAAESVVRQAIEEAGRLAQRIYPAQLHVRGLAGSLRQVAASAGVMLDVRVDFDASSAGEAALAVYTTLAEVIAATERGTQLAATVHEVDDTLEFELAGGAPLSAPLSERLRDRVEALGGELEVPVSGSGGRLAGRLPLDRH